MAHGQLINCIEETISAMKQGIASRIEIRVTNTTGHDIIRGGRTLLGRLQMIRSIVLAQVKLRESTQCTGGMNTKDINDTIGDTEPCHARNTVQEFI